MIVVNFLSYVMMWLMSSTLNIAIVRYIIGFSLPIRVVIAFRCKMNTSPPLYYYIATKKNSYTTTTNCINIEIALKYEKNVTHLLSQAFYDRDICT